jgi:hypothetical protein
VKRSAIQFSIHFWTPAFAGVTVFHRFEIGSHIKINKKNSITGNISDCSEMSNQRGKIKGFYPDMNFRAENKKTKGAGWIQVFFLEATDQIFGKAFPGMLPDARG